MRFDDFYEAQYRSLLALGYVLTGSAADAEDLVQDAFLAAHRDWTRISGYESPGGWLRRVVANRAASIHRRRFRDPRRRRGAEASFEIAMVDEAVWRAVRALPRRQAQLIALVYLEDLTVSDAAAILGIGEPTAKTHLQRARQALARTLDEGDER
jgi:RNA polymerase sigma-70 factor (ECF subfamily)